MAEPTAVRSDESRSTRHFWPRKSLSRLLSSRTPNHQIIEVPLLAVAGEIESQNGCITAPPATAATAAIANHPHSGDEPPSPPQSEQPIHKGPTNSQHSPTNRHVVSQSTPERAEDDEATQNAAEAHSLQGMHPRREEKGKVRAHDMNDAGPSASNVPVSANNATAQGGMDVPAIQAHPIEIPFNKTTTERLSKVEGLYMDKLAVIAEVISERWKNEIQGKLDKDLQHLVRAKFGVKDNIPLSTQLYMVGLRRKDILAVKPTIIITCGTMESKKWIAEQLGNLKLYYLDDFSCPWRVRYKRKPPSWTTPR